MRATGDQHDLSRERGRHKIQSVVRRIDRYLIAEVSGPFALGLLVYTFILILQYLFRLAELIIRRGVPAGMVAKLVLLSLPNILALTIPMALLFAALVAVGRLASDSELTALRSAGLSLFRLQRPLLAWGAALTLVCGVLMVWILPWANTQLSALQFRAATLNVSRQIEPRVFADQFLPKALYVREVSNGQWEGVFLSDAVPGDQTEITVADRGQVQLEPQSQRLTLHLENAVVHSVNLARPEKYDISSSARISQRLADDPFAGLEAKLRASKSTRSMTLGELVATAGDAKLDGETRATARVEFHKKFSIPFACLVFSSLALPLGFGNRRGGRSSGFAISIVVIVGYYLMLNNGEKAARFGDLSPILAAWAPNLLFAALAALLAVRRNRDRPLLPARLAAFSRPAFGPRRRPAAGSVAGRAEESTVAGERPAMLLRLPRWKPTFPNILDRYVLLAFARTFALVSAAALAIYVLADLSRLIDEVMRHNVSADVVATYYKYVVLQMFYDLAPILVLVTTLITFGLLARSNEVTAAKALGVSLFRLGVPALVAAAAVAVLCSFLQAQVLPAANEKIARLEAKIRGEQVPRRIRRADRQWLFGQGKYIYNYRRYDEGRKELQRLQIFEFDDRFRLIRRLFAESARWIDGRWVFRNGWTRTFAGGTVGYRRFHEPVVVDYPETPDYFSAEVRRPQEMNFLDLLDYTRELRDSGQPVQELEVSLHNKIAFPATAVIMALVALPFAFRLGKQGALYGLGISVLLGMLYLAVYSFFRTLGEAGALPPMLAVWAPSLLFGFFAGYLFLGVRS
jgi:LPS export ABC transporter permease LptG/LPS export ABC transporter permease LptF